MAETNVFIKFDPEKISAVATTLERQHKRLIESLSNISRRSESLANSWLGDSAELYMDKIIELKTQGDELAKILSALSKDLASASGIYKSGEEQATRKSESLPTDGVFLV